ncbi:MAG: NAD(P)H-dependent oxidoreductase, partial [Lachnospiraceae bacterium]|nr:NAD(P)H-dependent oxidoreductase [Lachnospiraceae bacterium]
MHVLIINASPRVKQYSNTDKILSKFTEGLKEEGATFTQYELSDRRSWDEIRKAYTESKDILIAMPLFVECVPGLLMEFLETLTPKNDGTKVSFILQGGFYEASQLRCGETYLEMLAKNLGLEYAGTLVKGGNFGIRLAEGEARDKQVEPFKEMGAEFAKEGSFFSPKCKAFAGPEQF